VLTLEGKAANGTRGGGSTTWGRGFVDLFFHPQWLRFEDLLDRD
jgi:hypothetical protein